MARPRTVVKVCPAESLNVPWPDPPKNLSLGEEDVHVWRSALDQTEAAVQGFFHLLAPDERGRAERFHFREDRERFIVARGLLRCILSHYLDVEPDRVKFGEGLYGKPFLITDGGISTVRFNLSHSRGLALYAITRNREVGIDLEYMCSDIAVERIAEQFFSGSEQAALKALPPNERTEAFFSCWTRKEAYIKARGEGVSFPLDQFSVSLSPSEPATLLSVEGGLQESALWTLRELTPGPGYAAALAVEGDHWRLGCWQWPESFGA